ncbi:MAG: PAS domain S-box protein [Synechococcales cyanobacterium M58_A2018_015]|nr:PAS domain S-box protein [Synechococcales cyanobacterium M58_A2018_015]
MNAPPPDNESDRLNALRQFAILDTEAETAFDDLARLAASICHTPIALVSLVDECRQWFKARVGLTVQETPRNLAFCAYAILQPQELLIVPDTWLDDRFATNPLVTGDPYIRFYAGAPLVTSDGYALGTLCVIDRVPRQLSPEQIEALRVLSRQVVSQLELRQSCAHLHHLTQIAQQAEQARTQLLQQEQSARAESEASRQQVTNILESITDAFFALDRDWHFTYLNHQAELLLQRQRQDLLGQRVWDAFPEAVGSLFYQQYHQAMAEQVSVEFEAFYPPLQTWFEVHAYPSPDGLSVYFRDISQRKQVEQRLQDTLSLQQAILDSANYSIISTTVDGIIRTFNAAAERWLGYTAAEVVGKTTPVLIHDWQEIEQRAAALSQELQTSIEPGFEAFVAKARRGIVDEQEWTYVRKDGSRFPVLLSVTALRDEHQTITGFLGIGSDISERRQAQQELQQQKRRAELFAEVTLKIRQSLQLDAILRTTVTEVQRVLQADRVLLFQLTADGGWGTVVQEAVVPGYPPTLGQDIVDPCFQEGYLEQYRQGRVGAITDIEQAGIEPCYVEFLQGLAVKANLVVPIFIRDTLWGLLIAHQCSRSRQWTSFETELLQQLADQIGVALSQAQLLEQEIRQRQELIRSQTDLRAMSRALESAVEGIAQLDTQGRYVTVNPAYAQMLGYSPEELLQMEWQQTLHPDDLDTLQTAYQQMLREGKAEVEVRGLRKDGTLFDKQVVMVTAYDSQQQMSGHYCFTKDISDRREIERLKDEFVSIVSHELRTPLTSISGALDLLANGVLQSQPEEAQRMLNIAAGSTDRLVRLINDILDIERIESGKITMTQQACNLADLMTQAVEEMCDMAARSSVTLAAAPLAVWVWADPDRIVQVLTNLISNAIKFSPPHSTVQLSATLRRDPPQGDAEAVPEAEPDSPYVLVSVQDQGRGIPADKLETIFERFQQVDASDSRQKGGTGLGLAICRTILQHHGGQIWAESRLGTGSTFYFTLPVLPGAEGTNAAPLPPPEQTCPDQSSPDLSSEAPPSLVSQRSDLPPRNRPAPLVLVCDDDAAIRTVIHSILERQGYRVITVASGQEAVDFARQHPPNVILLNLMMPGMDGWETLALLKQYSETQNIPVVIFSGLLPDDRQAAHPEVSDWIVKPLNQQLLSQSLERALAKQRHIIKVLVVEDDLDLAHVMLAIFSRHGLQIFHAATGREAIRLSQQLMPDLLILDLGLPECDGFAVVNWLRQHNRLCQVPLVVYTAQDLSEPDRERLRLGQTLFLTKGRITPQEFEWRVIDLLNRVTHDQENGVITDDRNR